MNDEQWRPVLGFEGLYEVSSEGRVRSLTRVVRRSDGRSQTFAGKIKATCEDNEGRPYLSLSRNGKGYCPKVCVLVAGAFLGSRPTGLQVCHNDGDASNNRASNLRYDTSSENNLDKVRHGTDHNASRELCIRNHVLDKPNLVPSSLKRGFRNCLACSRAASNKKYAKKMGYAFSMDTVADQHYARIMDGYAREQSTKADDLGANEGGTGPASPG